MANLSLRNIVKQYPDGFTAVKNFNLEIAERDFIVFVGPSGCGKSTTLRMIAGLEEITSGELLMNGQRLNETPAKDRDMAMVFQNYALYPHMTVYDNIAFSLTLRKVPKTEIKQRIEETARILDIQALLHKKPKALSGGQRQRVAMGRAIVRSPNLFLLDEPLSNLDAALRDQIRMELISLHKRLDATFVYVTHDQTEAMTLGTRIVIMKDGVVQQIGTPKEIYQSPCNQFVAGFIGSPKMNFLPMAVQNHGNVALLCFGEKRLPLLPSQSEVLLEGGYDGREIVVGLRPEQVVPVSRDIDGEGVFPAAKEISEMQGADSLVHLNCGGHMVTARLKTAEAQEIGEFCQIRITPRHLHLFDKETGLALK